MRVFGRFGNLRAGSAGELRRIGEKLEGNCYCGFAGTFPRLGGGFPRGWTGGSAGNGGDIGENSAAAGRCLPIKPPVVWTNDFAHSLYCCGLPGRCFCDGLSSRRSGAKHLSWEAGARKLVGILPQSILDYAGIRPMPVYPCSFR